MNLNLPMSANRRQVRLFNDLTGYGSGFVVLDIDERTVAGEMDGEPLAEKMHGVSIHHPKLDKVRRGTWTVELTEEPSRLLVKVDEDGDEEDPVTLGAVVYRKPDRLADRGSVFQATEELAEHFTGGRNGFRQTGKRSLRRWWPYAAHDDPITWTVFELVYAAYWRDTSPYQGYLDTRNW